MAAARVQAPATPLASAALPGVGSSPSAPMVRGLQAGITQRQSPVCRALAMGHVCRLPHNNQTIKGSPLPTPRPNTMGPLRTRGAERCSVAINVGEADHIEVPIIITNNNVTSNASQNSLLHLEEDRKKAQARPQSRPRIVGRVYWAWARSSSSPPYRDPTQLDDVEPRPPQPARATIHAC